MPEWVPENKLDKDLEWLARFSKRLDPLEEAAYVPSLEEEEDSSDEPGGELAPFIDRFIEKYYGGVKNLVGI